MNSPTQSKKVSQDGSKEASEDKKREAELAKWIGIVERKPKLYYGKNSDCSVIPEYLLPELAKKFEGVKKFLEPELSPEQKEIIELLEEEDLTFQYLDLGEFDGIWYYGFRINGREAIVTSTGNVYRVKEKRDSNDKVYLENQIWGLFNYEGNIGTIAPIISKETVKRFYTKVSRNHLINPKEIFKTVRDKILYYMDFSGKDEIADVLACWIIATYCYALFYWFPHILFNAPSQSGKTKGATIISYLSFRGFDLGASSGVTPAQIFRTLEGNRGTILIDEFEQSKGNQTSDTQQLVNQLLNASASKDAYVIRNEKRNNSWFAKKFSIFCPKIACNISGINPTSLSRYISFSWLKTSSEKGKRKPTREKDKKSFEPIRQDLYLLILENHSKIKRIYENLEIDLSNRDEDNWLPLFSIARFIDSCKGENLKVEEQLNKYLEDYKELQIEGSNDVADFFAFLYESIGDEEKYYSPKQIGAFPDISELYSYLKSPAHKVGKILKDYKFKQTKQTGAKKYLLSKALVKKIIDLYFNPDIIQPNATNATKQHQRHQITPNNQKKENYEQIVALGGIRVITPDKEKANSLTKEEKKTIAPECIEYLQELETEGSR
jgi:hypothetical protein